MTDAGQTPPGPGTAGEGQATDAAEAFARLVAPMATLLDSYARVMAQVAGGAPASGAPAEAMGLPAALVEAGVVASGSAARYGQRMTELVSRHQAALYAAAAAQAAAEAPEPGRKRADAELFRRFVREVSETALFEARRLERELETIAEAVARDADPPAPDAAARRYWRATP